MKLVIAIGLVPILSLTAKQCAAPCTAGSVSLRTEDDTTTWQEWLEEGQKQQANPKKPDAGNKQGGVNARGSGSGNAAGCKGTGNKSGGKTGTNSKMFGANGTQFPHSKTVAEGQAGKTPWRIDVENPAPGKREGSLHVQLDNVKGGTRYEYAGGGKFKTKDGDPLPNKVQKDIDKDPDAKDGILRGLQYLKEEW